MQIKPLSSELAVAAQISPEDVSSIADEGFRTIINNRPDRESPDQTDGAEIAQVSQEQGLNYVFQPVVSGGFTMNDVEAFGRLLDESEKPVLAYCRSGTRCTMLWALSQAGKQETSEIIGSAGKAGYDLTGMRGQIDSLAQRRKGQET